MAIVAASARVSLDDTIDRSFLGDLVVTSGGFGFGGFSPDLAERISDLPEVAAASPARVAQVQIDDATLPLLAVDPAAIDRIFDVGVVEGSLAALDGESVAVWDQRAAAEGWTVGDVLEVRFAETGAQPLRIAAVFSNKDLVRADFAVSTEVFDDNIGLPVDVAVYIAGAPGVDPAVLSAAVEATTAVQANASVLDLSEYKAEQTAIFDQMLGLVVVLLAFAVVIALFGIAITLALSVLERTHELGLLRAVGMSRGQVRAMVRWEAVIVAVFGSLLGIVVGIFFGWAVTTALQDEGITRFVVPVGQVTAVLVIAAVAGVLAAIAPARRAARLDVLAAVSAD
ncbi:MAG: ABC transporter permease [Acidimicrobiales bacterium]